MFAVSTVKPLCFSEPTLRLQQKFYSRTTSSQNLKFFLDSFRKNINSTFINKFYPKFEPFKYSASFKDHSTRIFRSCTKQCEFIFAHRLRRSQQIFSLYKKLWGDFRLLWFIQKFNANALKHRKLFYSASLTTGFAWEKKRISEDELLRLEKEISEAKCLYNDEAPKTPKDKSTGDLCDCDRCKHLNNDDDWKIFYSSMYLKIWRKEHENYKGEGLYVYKVYGKWDDVTANDLFQVQIDCKYRKEWDTNSVQLYVVDSDVESNSDVLYWEFLFPKMFYNRDYVCNRRYKIDHEKKLMTIVSESTEHPLCPEKPPVHRVKEYWSHIVIKPKEDFDKPGVEFTITYFDNPELSIPTYIALWYSISGMPDYLMKQKEAALKLAKYREAHRLLKENESQANTPPPPSSYQQNRTDKRFLVL